MRNLDGAGNDGWLGLDDRVDQVGRRLPGSSRNVARLGMMRRPTCLVLLAAGGSERSGSPAIT
jgi:hypothetical protein